MLYAVCRLDRFFNIYLGAAGLFALAIFETSAPVKEAMLLLILPYFSLSFGTGFAPVLRKVTRGADLSYGLFLYGFPVEQILRLKFAAVMGPWKTFVLATVISAGLAYVSWYWVEKPALGWKPRAKKRERDVGVSPQSANVPLDAPAAGR
jgi:peptidoglycan/LPS O-acetylase OafA/YrhL